MGRFDIRNLSLVWMILLLVGCTTQNLNPLARGPIRKIGIAYALPDQLEFQYTDLFIFRDETSRGDASAWKIDQAFFDSAIAALSPKYNVVTTRLDPDIYAKLDQQRGFFDAGPPSGAQVKAMFGAALPHADLWVVLRSACMAVAESRRKYPCGIGVTERLQLVAVAGIFAEMVVYDGNSFDRISSAPLRIPMHKCADEDGLSDDTIVTAVNRMFGTAKELPCLPGVQLDASWMFRRWSESSPQQRAALSLQLPLLMVQAVRPTLRQLNLIE